MFEKILSIYPELLFTILLIVANIFYYYFFKRFIHRLGKTKEASYTRIIYIQKYFNMIALLLSFVALSFIWSVNYSGILLVASSFFAVAGVALFAQWSIISNITSSVIIFFSFPARINDRIKIHLDGEMFVIGTIKEISLFQIRLENDEGELMFFPNNLLLQRPIVKLSTKKVDDKELITPS